MVLKTSFTAQKHGKLVMTEGELIIGKSAVCVKDSSVVSFIGTFERLGVWCEALGGALQLLEFWILG